MRICLNCASDIKQNTWSCSSCHWQPEIIDGYLIFSSVLNHESGKFFDKNKFGFLYSLEDKNFWFTARNKLITWCIKKYFPCALNFLEIGCGTGFVLREIQKIFPNLSVCGSDLFVESLSYAEKRINGKDKFFQMDARKIPYKNEFDLIGTFDVLEHISEDEEVIRQIHKALTKTGGLIISVPQHPMLWSASDELARHERRYRINELQEKLINNGFEILMTTSFVSLLLPLMMLSRFKSKQQYAPIKELQIARLVNFVLEKILNFERWLIECGMRFLFGGSRFVVARKI